MKITLKSTYRKAFRGFLATFIAFAFFFSANQTLASGGEEGGKFKAGEMIVHHISDAHSIHFFGPLTLPLPCIVKTDKGFDFFMSSVFMDEHHEMTKTYTSPSTGNTYALHHEQIYVVNGEAHAHDSHSSDTHKEAAHQDHNVHSEAVAVLHDNGTSDTVFVDPIADSLGSGMIAAIEEEEKIMPQEHFSGTPVIDFSITKSVLGMLLMLALVVFIFVKMAKAYEKRKGMAPKGMQNLLEPLVLFIKDEVAIPALGKKRAQKFLPFLLTVFFFIWACNMLGLIPFLGGFNITGTLSITLVLAAIVFIITTINGNAHYWGHIVWPPGVPLPIKFILVPIELLSVFIKPAVLMIRLTANINAGHIIILAFTSLIFIFGEKSQAAGYGVGVFATAFMIFMYFIELLVAFLQAYVFTLLAALYFGDATQEHHHEEAHH
ncbi:MAG: F0F1 ATP synthase subunit A [Flavobacteriales bacterium]|nr:F0F1 ATP synthase subunit A [Flavobacteriales bacterium]